MTGTSEFGSEIAEAVRSSTSRRDLLDDESESLFVLAPNAIAWCIGRDYLNSSDLLEYTRSFQAIRDFFELLCPFCNPDSDKDCWGKTEEQLRAQVLLCWDEESFDDVCPKCGVARAELIEDGVFKGYSQLHVISGQRCLSLDSTLLYTKSGLLKLGEVVKDATDSADVECSVADGCGGASIASKAWYAGLKPTKVLRTSRGYTLSGSGDHKIAVVRPDLSEEWVKVNDLSIGDAVKLRVGAELFGASDLSTAAARVLGYLVANGDVTDKYRFRFDHAEDEVCASFKRDVESLGLRCTAALTLSACRADGRKSGRVDVSGKEAVDWLRAHGLGPETAENKEVPFSVRTAGRDAVCAFVGAYVSCDGCASGKGDARSDITFTTVSAKLADQVRAVLLNIGVLTNCTTWPTRGFGSAGFTGTTAYHTTIAKESVTAFVRSVPLTSEGKKDRAAQIAAYYADDKNDLRSVRGGPIGSASEIRSTIRELDIADGARVDTTGRLQGGRRHALLGVENLAYLISQSKQGQRALTRELATKIADCLGSELPKNVSAALRNYADLRFTHVRVESVEDAEPTAMGDLTIDDTSSYVANGIVTHNSGKSITAAMIASYLEHRFLVLGHKTPGGLSRAMGLSRATQFEGVFVAASGLQAKETIWALFTNLRKDAPWIQRYTTWVKKEEKRQARTGSKKWTYEENQTFIRNEHPRVRMVLSSLTSNSRTARGRTRLFASMDEMSHMHETGSYLSAVELYRSLENSLRTIRTSIILTGLPPYLGAMISVTSPVSRDDPAMAMYKKAKAGRVRGMLAMHHATWDFNPREKFGFYADLMEKDPVGTMRDFGAEPPGAEYPLIHDESRFRALAVGFDRKPVARFSIEHTHDDVGHRYVGIKCDYMEFMPEKQVCLTFDAGLNFDAFTGICGYIEHRENGSVVTVPLWIFRIVPPEKTEVMFDSILPLIEITSKMARVVRVEFDRWGGDHLIQRIRMEYGLIAERRTLSSDDFRNFASDSTTGLIQMLPPQPHEYDQKNEKIFDWIVEPDELTPAAAAIYEMTRLQCDPETQKVYNPHKGQRRGFNCGIGSTPVVMADGSTRNLESVRAGDRVLDRTGRVQTVEAAWCSGVPDELTELEVYGRGKFRFTDNHEWPVFAWARNCQCGCGLEVKPGNLYVSGHNGGRSHGAEAVYVHGKGKEAKGTKRIPVGYDPMKLLRSDQIKAGDFMLVPREFDEVKTDTSTGRARLLGYYVSEGWIAAKGKRIDFAFAEKERDTWVCDVVNLLNEEGLGATVKHLQSTSPDKKEDLGAGGITIWTTNDHGRVDSGELAAWLSRHAGNGAKTKCLSEEVMRWPLELKRELIKGMFRGDGCQSWYVTEKNGSSHPRFSVHLATASETLRNQTELILAQLGFPSRRSNGVTDVKNNFVLYNVKIPQPWAETAAKLIWGDASVSGKFARKDPIHHRCMVDDKFVYLPVRAVRRASNVEPVYNLTVSGDHTYLVANVATHNSDDAARVMVHLHTVLRAPGFTEKQGSRNKEDVRKMLNEGHSSFNGSVFNPGTDSIISSKGHASGNSSGLIGGGVPGSISIHGGRGRGW